MIKFLKKVSRPLGLMLCLSISIMIVHAESHKVVAEPYYDIALLAKQLKTSKYNPFENPTGLFFKAGEEIKVEVGDMEGKKLELLVVDFSRPVEGGKKEVTSRYLLKSGENIFTAKNKGLAYVSYYTEDYKTAPKVTCTFHSGQMNGVFDPMIHTNADWKKMLKNAVFEVIDIKGKYVNLAFDVKSLKANCPNQGVEMINTYDQIILWEQDLMGLDQFGYRPNIRLFVR